MLDFLDNKSSMRSTDNLTRESGEEILGIFDQSFRAVMEQLLKSYYGSMEDQYHTLDGSVYRDAEGEHVVVTVTMIQKSFEWDTNDWFNTDEFLVTFIDDSKQIKKDIKYVLKRSIKGKTYVNRIIRRACPTCTSIPVVCSSNTRP